MNKHIILTDGRSGSNFLSNSLNIHPNVVNYGEVFGSWTLPSKLHQLMIKTGWKSASFLNLLYSSKVLYYVAQVVSAMAHRRKKKVVRFKFRHSVKTLGVKEFGIHFKKYQLDNYLLDNPDIKVIYLYRENILDRYVSGVNLSVNKVVLVEDAGKQLDKIKIDTADMLSSLKIFRAELDYTHKLVEKLDSNRLITFKYEDAFKDADSLRTMTNSVFQFLGVKQTAELSSQKKILPSSFENLIENYDEFRNALLNSEFASFLKQ